MVKFIKKSLDINQAKEILASAKIKGTEDEIKNYHLVLNELYAYPGGLNLGEICKKTNLSSRTVSKKLKSLNEASLIQIKIISNKNLKLYSLIK